MEYRKTDLSEGELSSSDEEAKRPRYSAETSVKASNIQQNAEEWKNFVLEEQLTGISSLVAGEDGIKVDRGIESFSIPLTTVPPSGPANNLIRSSRQNLPLLTVSPAIDDPFADDDRVPDIASIESPFGAPALRSEAHSSHQHNANQPSKKKCYKRDRRTARNDAARPNRFVTATFSNDLFLNAKISVEKSIEEISAEMCTLMGEYSADPVTSVVRAIGKEKALEIFEKTQVIQRNGGMLVTDGSRLRTPGGTFMVLFKTDTEIDASIKEQVTNTINGQRKWLQAKRRGRRPASSEDAIRAASEMLQLKQTEKADGDASMGE